MENNDLNCYFQPSWEMTSIDQTATDPFESALSSMVSSPTAASNGPDFIPGDGMMIRELIGRLGSICDSGEISPIGTGNNSTNTSCYSTPLNSPPKRFNLGSLIQMQDGNFPNYPSNLGSLNADPGFVERAAKFSCFGNGGGFGGGEMGIKNLEMKAGKLSRVSSNLSVKNGTANENGDSREGSSVSQNDANSKKRKSIPKSNVKDSAAKIDKVEAEKEKSNAKRSKKEDEVGKKENAGDSKNNNSNNSNDNANQKQNNDKNNNTENKEKEASKPEPPKDYIHVRARRGQATDSHSLAERVRREKISERMKFLQDLVPGCNKVTGKATVLDEIINYVQSLQRQVEFLSMKLATVNPRMEFNMDALLSSKDMFSTNGSPLAQTMYQVDQTSTQAFPLGYRQASQQLPLPIFANGGPNGINENPLSLNPLNNAGIRRNPSLQLPSIHGFVDSMTQMSNFWEDDLQSIVQMGLAQNQTPSIAGKLPNAAQMKAEL